MALKKGEYQYPPFRIRLDVGHINKHRLVDVGR